MHRTDVIPNQPAQFVAVRSYRELRLSIGPRAGQVVRAYSTYVGSSAREISAEDLGGSVEASAPVVWRFLAGEPSGGDDLESEPAWRELTLEVPASVTDARKMLERKIGGEGHTWYLMPKPEDAK